MKHTPFQVTFQEDTYPKQNKVKKININQDDNDDKMKAKRLPYSE